MILCWASFAAGLYSPWFVVLAVAALAWSTVESALTKQLKLKTDLEAKTKIQDEAIKALQVSMGEIVKAQLETNKQVNMLMSAKALSAVPRVSAR
jgi:hypothetical protein